MGLPSHYKLPGQSRGETCLICQTLTRGPTSLVQFKYGEYVYLCRGHASEEFRTQNGGRDFALSISKASKSAGRLTKTREKALRAIYEEMPAARSVEPVVRARPGSYAWKKARRRVEAAFAEGVVAIEALCEVVERQIGKLALRTVEAPSVRTVRRWRQERRFALPGWEPPPARRRG
jgi:hypothetical protein